MYFQKAGVENLPNFFILHIMKKKKLFSNKYFNEEEKQKITKKEENAKNKIFRDI